MILPNYSKYDVFIQDGKLIVHNITTDYYLKPIKDRWHVGNKFSMTDDNVKKKFISERRLSFALQHKINPDKIPRSARFYGTIDNLLIGERPKKEEIVDVDSKLFELEQSLFMLKYARFNNDYSNIVDFAYKNKRVVLAVVSKRIQVSYINLEKYWDICVDLFIDSIKEMKFTSLKPMINYLCTCLKYAYIRNKDKENIIKNGIERSK